MFGPEPDFFEVTVPCCIPYCDADVLLGDTRCSQHGGHPLMESRTDIYGHVTVEVQPKTPTPEGLTHA